MYLHVPGVSFVGFPTVITVNRSPFSQARLSRALLLGEPNGFSGQGGGRLL